MVFHIMIFIICGVSLSLNLWGNSRIANNMCFASKSGTIYPSSSSNLNSALFAHLSKNLGNHDSLGRPGIKDRLKLADSKGNFISRLTFQWVNILMKMGNNKVLELSDLWQLEDKDLMLKTSEDFAKFFEAEKSKSNTRNQSLNITHTSKLLNGSILFSYWKSPVTKALLKMCGNDNSLSR